MRRVLRSVIAAGLVIVHVLGVAASSANDVVPAASAVKSASAAMVPESRSPERMNTRPMPPGYGENPALARLPTSTVAVDEKIDVVPLLMSAAPNT
jgi:hypothetical protein